VGPDLGGMDGAGRKDHAVATSQFEPVASAFEHECDGAVHAIENLLIAMAVRLVFFTWAI